MAYHCLQEDERLLQGSDLSYNLRSIIKLRLQEKKLVLATITVIERALGRAPSGPTTAAVSTAGNQPSTNNTSNNSKKKNRKRKNKKKKNATNNTGNEKEEK